ncbi:MAG: putative rane protein [Bacteroidetes bacterium]|nr:putative rane protein [Bacteroidota bacterium]
MSTSPIIGPDRLNENAVRLVAAQVLLFAVLTLITGWAVFPIYLTIDFFLRAFTKVKPPFALIAQRLAKLLKLEVKPIYAPPKKFAAGIGFVFSITISGLFLGSQPEAANILTGVLAVFATLESVFSICAGCYVYDWIVAPILNRYNHRHA